MNKLLACGVVFAASVSGCATVRSNALGVVYSDTSGPVAVGVASASPKKGKACSSSILGIIASGDASIEAAKKAGGITKVASVDFQSSNILSFFAETCTIVAGE